MPANNFHIGQIVMLIGADDFMPPIGSIGEIIGGSNDGGRFDYEVLFPNCPCPVPPGEWYIPPYWLMPIDGRPDTEIVMDELEHV